MSEALSARVVDESTVADRVPLLELRSATPRVRTGRGTSPGTPLRFTPGEYEGPMRIEAIDLEVHAREIVALLGESASGNRTVARLAAGLLPLASGSRRIRGQDLAEGGPSVTRSRLVVQMVFQDGDIALDPRMRVVDIVNEGPLAHRMISPAQRVEYAALQLNRVGLDPMLMARFPGQFTPGQRVRIGIARALAVKPEVLVVDDMIRGLDLPARAQLLNLLIDLRGALDLACLFISRDIDAVEHVSDRVIVMHEGAVVESGPTATVFTSPEHPATRTLLGARIPLLRDSSRRHPPVREGPVTPDS